MQSPPRQHTVLELVEAIATASQVSLAMVPGFVRQAACTNPKIQYSLALMTLCMSLLGLPQPTGWLKQQKFLILPFLRLKVQDQDVS